MRYTPTANEKKRLLLHVLQMRHDTYAKNAPVSLSQEQQARFNKYMARLESGEPLSLILGYKDFWKHSFLTTCDTLDPRPESEHMIEAVLACYPDKRAQLHIADFGTGSGCLLLSLLHEYLNAQGTGIDASKAALDVAARNAEAMSLTERTTWLHYYWTNAPRSRYDVVVSNPPYIKSRDIVTLDQRVQRYDPQLALDGGADGLDAYRELFSILPEFLATSGHFICEIGAGQEADVAAIGLAAGFQHQSTRKDLSSIARTMIWTYNP